MVLAVVIPASLIGWIAVLAYAGIYDIGYMSGALVFFCTSVLVALGLVGLIVIRQPAGRRSTPKPGGRSGEASI